MRKILQFILKYLAKAVLWRTKPFVIGVTGSVGKTSTKEALFSVFNSHFTGRVRRNKANLNTEIGVPLTIIGGIDAKRNVLLWLFNVIKGVVVFCVPLRYPRVLILEMAADKPGDITHLSSIAPPHIAVVTAIGDMPVHVENFESREALIQEKSSLVRAVRKGGVAVLNYDDAAVRQMQNEVDSSARVITFGLNTKADMFAEGVRVQVQLEPEIKIQTRYKASYSGSTVPFVLKGRIDKGALYSALAAAAAGAAAGIHLVSSAEALYSLKTPSGRMQMLPGIKNTLIIDDSYNAAPLSMEAALETLDLFGEKRKVVVLGDMLELGAYTETAHRTAGKQAADAADILFFVGDAMRFAAQQAEEAGGVAHWFASSAEAAPIVQEMLNPGDIVLVKGSHSMHMEKIVSEIKQY